MKIIKKFGKLLMVKLKITFRFLIKLNLKTKEYIQINKSKLYNKNKIGTLFYSKIIKKISLMQMKELYKEEVIFS